MSPHHSSSPHTLRCNMGRMLPQPAGRVLRHVEAPSAAFISYSCCCNKHKQSLPCRYMRTLMPCCCNFLFYYFASIYLCLWVFFMLASVLALNSPRVIFGCSHRPHGRGSRKTIRSSTLGERSCCSCTTHSIHAGTMESLNCALLSLCCEMHADTHTQEEHLCILIKHT